MAIKAVPALKDGAGREDQVRIYLEKKAGEAGYRKEVEASSITAAYNALAVLIRDLAEATEQPLDHVVSVLATILLTRKAGGPA